jgi:hypothetical protein
MPKKIAPDEYSTPTHVKVTPIYLRKDPFENDLTPHGNYSL